MFEDSLSYDFLGDQSSCSERWVILVCVLVNRWPHFELFENTPSSMAPPRCGDHCKPVLEFPKESGFVTQRFLKLQVYDNDRPFEKVPSRGWFACLLAIHLSDLTTFSDYSWYADAGRQTTLTSLRLSLALILLTHRSSHAVLWVYISMQIRTHSKVLHGA